MDHIAFSHRFINTHLPFQLPESRDRCIYMANLPASVTVQKMEGVLEMEADCSVEEIFLLKVCLRKTEHIPSGY